MYVFVSGCGTPVFSEATRHPTCPCVRETLGDHRFVHRPFRLYLQRSLVVQTALRREFCRFNGRASCPACQNSRRFLNMGYGAWSAALFTRANLSVEGSGGRWR